MLVGDGASSAAESTQFTSPCPAAYPESFLQQRELTDEVCDGIGEGLLRTVVWSGLHTNDDLVLQGVGDFVASKQHLWVLQQLAEKQVYCEGDQAWQSSCSGILSSRPAYPI